MTGLTFALMLLGASAPALAQPVIFIESDPTFQEQDLPWEISDELLERLARRAADYEEAAAGFECSETAQRVKYPRGRVSESEPREATYLFALEQGTLVPVAAHGKSVKRYGKSHAPPAHAWTRLFAESNQPWFAYRDLGEVPSVFGEARKIQFRGVVPYGDGGDIREWEGTVLVDAHSLLPLELDAQPLHLWPRLDRQRHEYLESFKLAFFGLVIRFKKRPIAERVHVRFDMQSNGMTLPVDAHVERIEMTSADQAVVRSRVVAHYEHRFEADDGSSGAAP